MSERHIQDVGVTLHRRPYRETSMIVDFFLQNHGRKSAVVRGLRNAKSDRKSLLQPFQPVTINLTGKSDLKTLTSVEAEGATYGLKAESMYCGLYLNELITRTLPKDIPTPGLYHAYLTSLESLSQSSVNEQPASEQNGIREVTLRLFEFALLDELGVLPDLSSTDDAQSIHPERLYRFERENGVVQSESSKNAFVGQYLIDMVNSNWNAGSRKVAKLICRQALHPFLGDKPLHSRALFRRA